MTTRRKRQQAEIAAAAIDRPAHAVDLAFEHFEEYGPDPDVIETLSIVAEEHRDPALAAEFGALVERFSGKAKSALRSNEPET